MKRGTQVGSPFFFIFFFHQNLRPSRNQNVSGVDANAGQTEGEGKGPPCKPASMSMSCELNMGEWTHALAGGGKGYMRVSVQESRGCVRVST
jgi:hypothetical protein